MAYDDSLAVVASTSVTAVNGEHSVDVEEKCQWRALGRKNATKHAAKCENVEVCVDGDDCLLLKELSGMH